MRLRLGTRCLLAILLAGTSSYGAEFFGLNLPGSMWLSGDGTTILGSVESFYYAWRRDGGLEPFSSLDGNTNFRPFQVSFDGRTLYGMDGERVLKWGHATGFEELARFDAGATANFISDDESIIMGVRPIKERAPNGLVENRQRAIRWSRDAGVEDLPFTGEIGSVVRDMTSNGSHVLLVDSDAGIGLAWNESGDFEPFGNLPSTTNLQPQLISEDGNTVWGWLKIGRPFPTLVDPAFRWTPETGVEVFELSPTLKGADPKDMNDDGTIWVGTITYGEPGGPSIRRAAIWDEHDGLRELHTVLAEDYGLSEEIDGWTLSRALAISRDGRTIAGSGLNPEGIRDHWIAFLDRLGDFNANGQLDVADIDLLSQQVRLATHDTAFDVNSDGLVTDSDRIAWVTEIASTYFGDANLDGEFNSGDLVAIFKAGEYDDDLTLNSTWSTGDWNGDGEFSSSDLVVAFQHGGYEVGPRSQPGAVPEPATPSMLSLVLVGYIARRRIRPTQA